MEQELKRLNWVFRNKTKNMKKNNEAGTPLHVLQCDFAYILNELKYNFSPSSRAKANRFIAGIPDAS